MTPAEQLCLACGMCCDGSLFDLVRLGPANDAAALKAHGLPVKRSRAKEPVTFFRQPCAALCDDRTCRVYANRPSQCRAFECGVFKEMQAGRLAPDAALKQVRSARQQAENIRRLLRALGDTDEHLSLHKRVLRMQRHLEEGDIDAEAADLYVELSQAILAFDLLKQENFYTRES